VIFDGALVLTGDDDDLLDARRRGLFDDVLNDGLIDDGQHLLGLGLGRRQEARAKSRRGNDGLADLHKRDLLCYVVSD
jgi:hypothetical protein